MPFDFSSALRCPPLALATNRALISEITDSNAHAVWPPGTLAAIPQLWGHCPMLSAAVADAALNANAFLMPGSSCAPVSGPDSAIHGDADDTVAASKMSYASHGAAARSITSR